MDTKKDLLNIEMDIPTTPEDIRALRENRPKRGEDWLNQLTKLSQQIPNLEEVHSTAAHVRGIRAFRAVGSPISGLIKEPS